MLKPEEVARSVLYLASALPSGVIGATIDLSVGRVAGYQPSPNIKDIGESKDDAEWALLSKFKMLKESS